MALLYFAWFVLELPFVFTRFSTTNIWGIIKSFFFSNTFYASWYLTASIEGMALCVLLSKWLSNKWLLFVGGVLYCLAVFGGGYFGIVPNYIQSLLLSLDNIIPLTNSFIPAFIYCVLGKIFSDNAAFLPPQNDSNNLALVGIGLLVLLLCESILMHTNCRHTDTFFTLPAISWILLCFATREPFWAQLSSCAGAVLRKSSTLIYFMHYMIILAVTPLLSSTELYRAAPLIITVKFFLVAFISVLISFIIIRLSSRIRVLRVLY